MILTLIHTAPALATDDKVGAEFRPHASLEYAFESGLYMNAQGGKIVSHIPMGVIEGVEPVIIDGSLESYRSQDQYIALNLRGKLCAFTAGLMPKIYQTTNQRLLDRLSQLPRLETLTPEGLLGSSRFFSAKGQNLILKSGVEKLEGSMRLLEEDSMRLGMSLIEARGMITVQASIVKFNTFFHPLNKLVLASNCEACPIQEVIFELANNQFPMRICGEAKLLEQETYLHLETNNVARIKIVLRDLKTAVLAQSEEKAAE